MGIGWGKSSLNNKINFGPQEFTIGKGICFAKFHSTENEPFEKEIDHPKFIGWATR